MLYAIRRVGFPIFGNGGLVNPCLKYPTCWTIDYKLGGVKMSGYDEILLMILASASISESTEL